MTHVRRTQLNRFFFSQPEVDSVLSMFADSRIQLNSTQLYFSEWELEREATVILMFVIEQTKQYFPMHTIIHPLVTKFIHYHNEHIVISGRQSDFGEFS